MAWVLLFAASAVEIVMALALKYTEGWTRLWPSVTGIVAGGLSVYLLTLAMRDLPAGTAYAAWTGTGALGITVLGIILFGDPLTWQRLACIVMIVLAVIGLKLTAA